MLNHSLTHTFHPHFILSCGAFCAASPQLLGIQQTHTRVGCRHLESYFACVRRALAREVAVFEKA